MVRSFPRSTRHPARLRAVVASAAVLVVSVPMLAGGATAADKLHRKQHDVHRRISSAQGDLEESSGALRAAARRLESSRAALSGAQHRLDVAQRALSGAQRADAIMQGRLESAEHALRMARQELDAARDAAAEQRAEIGELAASNYANGDPALMGLSVILRSQDASLLTSQLNTVSSLMSRQTATLARLRAARAAMVVQEAKVEKATDAVAAQRKITAARLVRTQALESSAAAARTQLATMVGRNHAAEILAARARRADAAQLRVLKTQENRIKRLIMERAARQHGGFKGDAGGFLMRPVPGYITSPYGWRIHPIYHYWGLHDGTDFSAPCGTPEHAVSSGTVISKSWSDVYGNRLYLDLGRVNGKNLTAVYNHLSAYRANVGERVSRGETVGIAGTTGWSTACHLHFTVLLDGNPVDPMRFM